MMKTLRIMAAIAFTLTVVGWSQAHAIPNSPTATADATATIVAAISIDNTEDLNFGEVVTSSGSGTVTVSPAGVRTASGVTLGSDAAVSAASFSVTGGAGYTYDITLPSSSVTLSDNGNTMSVDNFISDPSGSGTLSSGGTQTLNVGATLTVGENQAPGSYSGSFVVTVAYD